MDIGGTKMESPRFLQENPTQSAGGSASSNTCSNSLDNARSVAMETTPNPLSYWPPPASALPLLNSSKELDGQEPKPEPPKNEFDAAASQPRIHHNLPPIAGITSSQNYRVHKQNEEQKPSETKNEPPKTDDCEIVKGPAEHPKADYLFPAPASVNKSRASTPLVQSPPSETLTLNINSCNSFSAGSPSPSSRVVPSPSARTVSSPSSRTVPSPHFVAPPSIPPPSENPRMPSNRNRLATDTRMGLPQTSMPYVPNSHQGYLNTPRTCYNSVQPSPFPVERINQPSDTQTCRNPFELPMPKSYQYQTEHYPNNVTPKLDQYNIPRDRFYPMGYKQKEEVKYKVNTQSKMYEHDNSVQRTNPLPQLPVKSNPPTWGKEEVFQNKLNGGEYKGYQNSVKPDPYPGRYNEKQNGNYSQRYPPVPQSNYDLNRHLYDNMTGNRTQPGQKQFTMPPRQPQPQPQPYFRPEEQQKTMKQELTPQQRANPHFNNTRPMEQRTQGYRMNVPQRPIQSYPEMEVKPTGSSSFPAPQKPRTPTSTPLPARSKRESPLDLSVKTVRQSADSTAKDDGDVYLQNFRNFLHTNQRYPVQTNENATGAPKIDFTPNFSNFHETQKEVLPPVESFKKFSPRMPVPVMQNPKIRPNFNPPPKYLPPSATSQKQPEPVRYPESLKRPADDIRGHSQAKIPKIDPWKLAFDQQIEQRINSARISHQNSQNTSNGLDATRNQQYNYQRHSGNYRSANMYPQPPVQTSATPYNPSYVQQPQCQPATPQTPQHRENVGHSPDPEQIIKQISKGVMPDHKLLQDKNVLSILRSSLEEKEAKLLQLQEVAKRKEKYKELTEQKKSLGTTQGKNLPPFGALTLERMCAPPSFPGHRLNIPRAVDTVKIDVEPTQKYFNPAVKNEGEKNGIPSADLSPQDDAQGPPTDLDGLAAFLAARIRTKGELKQVGPSLEPGRPLGQHFKMHPGSNGPINESIDRSIPASHSFPTTNFQTNGSPPKLVRESRLLPPLRRRLFSHAEEETPTTSGTQNEEHHPMPSRDPNGIRSSSETSVFDFRESDSEGEMPVLERQTLEGMRRDRKTFGSKQNVSTTTPDEVMDVDKPEVIAELDKSHPDPFWDTAFDMFVEQLEKRPPKRSMRKKKVMPLVSETEDVKEVKEVKPELERQEVVKEEKEKQTVPEGHIKLSSSRLKVYEDEMKLKEEKEEKEMNEMKGMKDEKEEKEEMEEKEYKEEVFKETEELTKKDESGVKTRGKSKKSVLDDESDTDVKDQSDSDSTVDDDDDSLSLSGLESESSESETSEESSNSDFSDDSDSSEGRGKKRQRIQTRLQTRSTRQKQVKTTGMKLRSKPAPTPKAVAKPAKKKKKRKDDYYGKKKKPSFGDGSDFRPGWEEECYKFKQQLRMPEKLISISRPPKRSSVSLPDLDPYRNSPSLDSSDVSVGKKQPETDESDADSRKKLDGNLLKSRNGKKSQSIINMLVNKYGKNLEKRDLKAMNERKSPRILPKATNKPELLPTPSLGIGKENVLKKKGKKKDESDYLTFFRRKTVNNFKEAFKQKGILPQDFIPTVLKSRTRTQARDLKRATLAEVFGEERPASAPPIIRDDDTSTDQEKEKTIEKKKRMVKKVCSGVVTRGRGKLTRSGRPGLRSTAVLRSAKAVQISKRHLNQNRKRNIELLRIRAMASKKFYLVNSDSNQLPITKKRLKLRSVRRKFRSGFDYIRKKKKMKKDGDSVDGSVKEKRLPNRPTSESVEDVQNEIKNWVINKGLGETILHRAARLGYTDVAAYCLEKMDCSPSPRDNAGYTPLHEACSRGHLDIAKLLLMYGASVSESAKGGIRPLHEAAENGFTELIRLLLSYGADPLLETYTGHTALSLVTDEEARRLIQHHLADVQGNVAPVWTFQGPASLFDPMENGYDPLIDPPSPASVHSDFELELSDTLLPPVYQLSGDREPDRRWILMRDLLTFTKAKSKEVLLKQIGCSEVREMKLTEFAEQSKSCSLLGVGDKPPTKACKVILVPYDEKVRQLLNVETVVV